MRTTVKISVALFLCAIVLVTAQDKEKCKTENNDDGVCVNLPNCYALRHLYATAKHSAESREANLINLERKKCSEEAPGEDLVCCKAKPPIQRNWTFEDVKPLLEKRTNLLPNASLCGAHDSDRIFYGNETGLGQFPWLALMRYIDEGEETFVCGGSLINQRYIITAAHCINSNIFGVRIGEWDLKKNPDCIVEDGEETCAPPVIDAEIEKIIIHKNYTRRPSQGGKVDMALIRMDRDVTFNEYVHPICLPMLEAQAVPKKKLYISGWGLTEDYTPSTKKLFAVVDYVEEQQCKEEITSPFLKVDDTIICARGAHKEDSCSGDSGGPLMHIATTKLGKVNVARLFLSGVISKGLACGTTKPAFYTSIYKQMDWILSNMEP